MKKKRINEEIQRIKSVIPLMDNPKGKKILELGTGPGELLKFLTKKGANVTGLDIAPNKKLLQEGYSIKKHDLNTGIPSEKNSFDVVIALEVLEHLFNPYEMMDEIQRVLKKGGSAIISMPNTDGFFSRIGQLYEKRGDKLDIYWHHYQPSVKSIQNLVNTRLKIVKEIGLLKFNKFSLLNSFSNLLLKINRDFFCGGFMVKAIKN